MAHLFCLGDSITDCGRLWENPPLGCGYVQLLNESFQKENLNLSITNCGIDGFTVSRVLANTSDDTFLSQINQTDIITLLIGINDIGLMQNTCRTEAQKMQMMDTFLHNYDSLIHTLIHRTSRIILMEPFLFPYPQELLLWIPYVLTMSQGIREIAQKHDIAYVSLQDSFNKTADEKGFPFITTDGIHLTKEGHKQLCEKLFPIISSYFL